MAGTATIDRTETRVARPLRAWPPPAVAALVAFLGYLVLAALLIAIGLFLMNVLIPGPVGAWDNGVSRWFLEHRTPGWNAVTDVASIAAGTGTILTFAFLAGVVLAIRRRWWDLGFLSIALSVEFCVFLTTVTLIDRPRPTVPKLDGAAPTSSFPSGHVAAAVALYIGLAILLSARTRGVALRIVVWAAALTLVLGVGVSRVYRGLHHPIDVFAGVMVGVGALVVATVAIGVARAPTGEREEPAALGDEAPAPQPIGGRR
jgi:undecaprenyl-diphosphatase